jgi:phage baseplate assembly protein W
MNGDSAIDISTFGAIVQGIDDIVQCWSIILHTIPGSDPLRPDFGSDIYKYLDKANNSFGGNFSSQIIKDLERWETRCSISQVKVAVGDDNNIKVNILGVYKPTNTVIEATLSLDRLGETENTTKMSNYSGAYNDKQCN